MLRLKKYNLKSKAFTLFSLLFVLLFLSCDKVVELDLESGDPKIVIDAEIIWEKGTSGNQQSIKITRMAPYYSPTTPKVSGAQVRVENSKGDVFTFNESEPGLYVCTNFVPVIDMEYKLFVNVDGQTLTATEKLIAVPPVEKIDQEFMADVTGEDLIVVTFYYKDPANQANYYLTDYKSDILPFPEYTSTSDEFVNGNEINEKFTDTDLKPGKVLDITHRGVSKNFYNYMNLILEVTNSNPFAATPGNIRGNIINTTNANNFALGYFRVCEANKINYVVK
ncbi:DUF4249 domain-containing protein [Flavobacterium hibernum]|uniref:DUF4249 domain-containing protein n=1 Tax=Flavobacterium hibernum TaxID=37752 RepID=A0A0D0F188_9FLAO|nr:DUF4249 domain-containing protein [Flavobacterium hibernum]KIO51762.1 hypothetical protein IW18_15970 [Flavobacterium hibernum]OXA91795.1 hypothetical protein B0A73_00745 [Flavobacterium hibernum]STO09706.1 Uncharacterised protein [Flavobacterium hibernum]